MQNVEIVDSIVTESLDPWRFALLVLSGLAGSAGDSDKLWLFAALSLLVRERRKELLIRMAVRGSHSKVMNFLGQSLKMDRSRN